MTSIVLPSIESSILCDACFDQLSRSIPASPSKFNCTRPNVHAANNHGSPLTPGVETASNEFLAAVMSHDYIQWGDADLILVVSNSSACREAYSKLQKEVMNTMYRHCDAKTRAIVLTAFAHFSSLTLSRPSESISTNTISASVSPHGTLPPIDGNSPTDRTGMARSHSCTEVESTWEVCHALPQINPKRAANDDPTTSKKERAWNLPSNPCRFSGRGLCANGPAFLPPPITVEHRDEPLHNIPKVTCNQVKTFEKCFNNRFLSITGGRDMNYPAVDDAWRRHNGFHRLRQLLRLIESIRGMPGDEQLSEAHASEFHALSADIERLLKSISVTLKASDRTRARAFPLEELPCSESLTADSTVSAPFRGSLSGGTEMKNATSYRIPTPVPWPKELEEDQFSYGNHIQPPEVADDFAPTYSELRNTSTTSLVENPPEYEAHPSLAITGSMITATDPNEVYLPTPPAGSSSRRGAISRSCTPAPIVPTMHLEVPILHEKPAQVSKIPSRGIRPVKSTNRIDQYSGSAPAPIMMTPQVSVPIFSDSTLFKGPAETANPVRNQKGEIVRFYGSYMTVGGAENGLIPCLSAGNVPESLMIHHPHA